MSAATLQAIEDAVAEHLKSINDGDEADVVTAWVVGLEAAGVMDVGPEHGGTAVGYTNHYVTSLGSPHMHRSLALWTAGKIAHDGLPYSDDE